MNPVYPVNDYGPLMPGLVMAGVAIFHLFLAQFAVGGGFLLCYFQWLAMTGRNNAARRFINDCFKVLVLISFVLGALTGVGIWFTAVQVSAATIGEMVFNFHWIWATEWAFFCLEIVAGYCFFRYHKKLSDRSSLTLLVLYTFAAWMSLFWINGILSWQLTPGHWLQSHDVFDGFSNPSFWPSLFFRTVVCLTLASLAGCVVVSIIPDLDRDTRTGLINRAAHLMLPMLSMPLLGAWFLWAMPQDSWQWVLGGSPAMMPHDGAVQSNLAGRPGVVWLAAIAVAVISQIAAWAYVLKKGTLAATTLAVITAGNIVALVGTAVLREIIRLPQIDLSRIAVHAQEARSVGGFSLFPVATVVAGGLIIPCGYLTRSAWRNESSTTA